MENETNGSTGTVPVTQTNGQAVATLPQAAPAPALYSSPESEQFAMEQRMAKLFVQSGLFSDIKGQSEQQSIAQAYVKIAIGKSMGFTPSESMQGIDIIQGRPAVSAQLRAARMQRAGFSWTVDALDDHGCELTVYFGSKRIGYVGYSDEDAKRAGLLGKDNWKKDPSSMHFARAITRAQRRFAPGVLSCDLLSREEAIDIDFTEVADRTTQIPAAQEPRRKSEELAGQTA